MRTTITVLFCAIAFGCSSPTPPVASAGKDEESVRQVFAALQAAIKASDADKIWELLDGDSKADADKAAATVRESFTKADAAAKAELEIALAVTAAELGILTGKSFLKSKRFSGKYNEIPESKIDKVTVQGDAATVFYTEPDGDKEKLSLVRQDGKWTFSVPMPKGN